MEAGYAGQMRWEMPFESFKENMPSAEEQHNEDEQGEQQTAKHLLAVELHWPRKYWSMGML
jgi:hypothetical protein